MNVLSIPQRIGASVSILIATASAGVALIDFFNLFGFSFDKRIPALILFLVSTIVVQHVFETGALLRRMDTGIADLQNAQFKALRERLDPEMSKVYGELVDSLITNVNSAVRDCAIEITDLDLFRYYYRKTLDAYPRCTFLATSIPSESYFWKNDPTEQAIAEFIRRKGTVRRIFFTDHVPAELAAEERQVVQTHVELGVEVFVIHANAVPRELGILFFTESRGRLAWEAAVGGNARMRRISACTNQAHNRRYLQTFQSLMQLPGLHRAHLESDGGTEALSFTRVHAPFGAKA